MSTLDVGTLVFIYGYYSMEIFKNKFFILGNLLLVLVAIPLTLFFISTQTKTRSSAAPNTLLSLSTTATAITPGQNFDVDVTVNPGNNLVSIVDMDIRYDPTKLEYVSIARNEAAFPQVSSGPITSNGAVRMAVTILGANALSTQTKVATITFKPVAGSSGPTEIKFFRDPTDTLKGTRVFSTGDLDGATENVLQTASPLTVNIGGGPISPTPTGGTGTPSPTSPTTPTPTGGTTLTPVPTSPAGVSPTSTATISPTATVTAGANQPPICTSLTMDRQGTGVAPYSLTFTANGRDPDGTISKVSFDFGDGPVQDVTQAGGIGTTTVSVQIAHTYRNAGTFTATVTFTDNQGAISNANVACSQTITVSQSTTGSTGGTTGGTSGGTTGGTTGGTSGGAQPTLAPTGSVTTTLGIIGGILLTIIGGALLLIL